MKPKSATLVVAAASLLCAQALASLTGSEYRRSPNERVYEAEVIEVHAVIGHDTQHCWVERDQVEARGGDAEVVATVLATAHDPGFIAVTQRCDDVHAGKPLFWDVGYRFRNLDHRAQISAPPGPTISVNKRGEPRL